MNRLIATLFLSVFLMFGLSGCASGGLGGYGGLRTNGFLNVIPGVGTNQASPVCDQLRDAQVCKVIDLELVTKIIKLRLATGFTDKSIDYQRATDKVDAADKVINMPGITSGQIFRLVAKHFQATEATMYADAVGFGGVETAQTSTFILTDADREALMWYLNQIRVFVETYGPRGG